METLTPFIFSWMKDILFFMKSFLYLLAVSPHLSLILYLWLCLGFFVQIQLFFPLILLMEVAVTPPHYFDFRGAYLPEILEE